VKYLEQFTRLFHNGRPRLALYQGLIAKLEGKLETAQKAWKKISRHCAPDGDAL
jgi:hypothetical protein